PEWMDVERNAKDKDRLFIDFEGFVNDAPLKDGAAKNFQLVLGSKQMIPGFEEALLGAKLHTDFEIKLKFPEDYHWKEVAGKEALFKIKVHKIQEPKYLDVSDALAEKLGMKDGLNALRTEARKNLELNLKQMLQTRFKSQVLEKLLELN